MHSPSSREPESGNVEFGGHHMHRAHRYIASLFLTAALAAPIAIMAAPMPQSANLQVRYYDKNHKDYHNWDDRENKSWGIYLSSNHKKDHEFAKASGKEQSQYWNWRHSHPDKD
jgi:uncharacterized protein YqjF (DUF2071 family)